jgi:Cu-Zn family superoxide dismutase
VAVEDARYNVVMKNGSISSAIALCFFLALSLAAEAKTTVELKDAQGKNVGTAVLWSKGASSGVSMELKLHDLPPGVHALHFHQKAQCDAPDFKSAGPHFNPEGKKHGLENPEGHHAGDMNNFTVDAKGKAKFKVVNKDVTLGDDSHSLFSNGGTARASLRSPSPSATLARTSVFSCLFCRSASSGATSFVFPVLQSENAT